MIEDCLGQCAINAANISFNLEGLRTGFWQLTIDGGLYRKSRMKSNHCVIGKDCMIGSTAVVDYKSSVGGATNG